MPETLTGTENKVAQLAGGLADEGFDGVIYLVTQTSVGDIIIWGSILAVGALVWSRTKK